MKMIDSTLYQYILPKVHHKTEHLVFVVSVFLPIDKLLYLGAQYPRSRLNFCLKLGLRLPCALRQVAWDCCPPMRCKR